MIDVRHEVSAVQRDVGTRVLDAGEARVVTVTRRYPTSVEDLWDACTNPERIPRWFLPVSGDLRVGGRYALEGNASGTVLTCDPPHSFTATWEYGDEVSWIELRLIGEGDEQTRFELQHVAHVDDERWAEFGPGAVGIGWDLALLGLVLHLESKGAAVDPAEFAAWSASDEGKAFMGECSDAWRDASVDAGTPVEDAAAAAERVTAAYTGA